MAHLWFRSDDDVWSVMELNGRAVNVSVSPPRGLSEDFRLGADALAALIRAQLNDTAVWVLLVAADGEARVNGLAPVAGMRVLEDRDEIRVNAREPLFFSTETLARVEAFTETGRAIFCGRCRQPLRIGDMAVRCPGCAIWHHQTEELPCWTYAPTCSQCQQPTALEAGFQWMPEA